MQVGSNLDEKLIYKMYLIIPTPKYCKKVVIN